MDNRKKGHQGPPDKPPGKPDDDLKELIVVAEECRDLLIDINDGIKVLVQGTQIEQSQLSVLIDFARRPY